MRKKYETDLTDEQWDVIAPLFVNMRKRKWDKRELVNAVLYLVKTGCQWRNLPHDLFGKKNERSETSNYHG